MQHQVQVLSFFYVKTKQKQRGKDMAAAEEMLRSQNLNQFKRGKTNQQVAAQDEEEKTPHKFC